MGGCTRAIVAAVVLGLAGLAAPAGADAGSYDCTVLVGTELDPTPGDPFGVSSTSPAGGVGECQLHTLDESSKVTDVDAADGCDIYVEQTDDGDAFVDGAVQEGQPYFAGDSFVAFCEAGTTMADNGLTFADL